MTREEWARQRAHGRRWAYHFGEVVVVLTWSKHGVRVRNGRGDIWTVRPDDLTL